MTVLVIGIGLISLSLLADTLEIGGGRGFGYQQLIVLIAGMVAVLFAGAILLQPQRNDEPDNDYMRDPDSENDM